MNPAQNTIIYQTGRKYLVVVVIAFSSLVSGQVWSKTLECYFLSQDNQTRTKAVQSYITSSIQANN